MSTMANSVYGIVEFQFSYTAGKDWSVQCKFSALPGNPIEVVSVRPAGETTQSLDPDHWLSFIQDMGLEKDFKSEAISFALYNYVETRALSGRPLSPPKEN